MLELQQVLDVLVWALILVGGSYIAVLLWIGKQLGKRLEGIETQIKGTNVMLGNIEKELRSDIMQLDRRLVAVETTCDHHINDRRK